MPRLSRALSTLPAIFEPVQAGDDLVQPPADRGEAGVGDPVAVQLEIGNVRTALEYGQVGLGTLIGAAIVGAVTGRGK